jgi:CRP-like cAMP-binding protein
MVPSQLQPYLALMSRLPLFRGQDDLVLESILRKARLLELRRGERLFCKGDPSNAMFCVATGRVRLFFCSEQGHEKVLEIVGPGRTFGEAAVFLGQPYPVFAETMAASTVISVPRDRLLGLIECDPGVAHRMIANLSQRLHALIGDMENFCIHNARERVVGFLAQQVRDQQGLGDGINIRLPATKSTTASLLNLTPETFSRVLHKLEHDEVLALDGRNIRILDAEQLFSRSPC